MFLFLSWTCFSLPATFSLIAETLEANRHSMGIGMQSVIKRLPIMIAPFLGGVLIDRFGMINGSAGRIARLDRPVGSHDWRATTVSGSTAASRPGNAGALEFLAQPNKASTHRCVACS